MGYAVRWGGNPEDVTIAFAGRVPVKDVLSAFDDVRAAPQYRKSLRIIQDHVAADWSQITPDAIRERAEAIVAYTEPDERHVVAVVVDNALGFGLMRMREAHIAGRIATVDRAFYDLESARNWLREQRIDDGLTQAAPAARRAVLRCIECGRLDDASRGWKARVTWDGEFVTYCPACDAREFGSS
jgi:hypothetical protein